MLQLRTKCTSEMEFIMNRLEIYYPSELLSK
jgi:hypothetical protein